LPCLRCLRATALTQTCRLAPARPFITYQSNLGLAALLAAIPSAIAVAAYIALVVLASLAAALLTAAALLGTRLSFAVVMLRVLLATLLATLRVLTSLILALLILVTLVLVRHNTLASKFDTGQHRPCQQQRMSDQPIDPGQCWLTSSHSLERWRNPCGGAAASHARAFSRDGLPVRERLMLVFRQAAGGARLVADCKRVADCKHLD
jgi:hypothetical protein